MIAAQPRVVLLSDRCVEVPVTVICTRFRKPVRIAVDSADAMRALVLCLEVKDVDGETSALQMVLSSALCEMLKKTTAIVEECGIGF